MLNVDCLCSICQVCQMIKKEKIRKKYGLILPKIAEPDIVSLSHGLCGSAASIYNEDTIHNKLSASLLALTMIDPAIDTGWFEIVQATNKSASSIQYLFHYTWLARYPRPQFIVFENGSMGELKREFKQMCERQLWH
jgi:hypothetical protein